MCIGCRRTHTLQHDALFHIKHNQKSAHIERDCAAQRWFNSNNKKNAQWEWKAKENERMKE